MLILIVIIPTLILRCWTDTTPVGQDRLPGWGQSSMLINRAIEQGAEPENYLFDVDRFIHPSGKREAEPAIQPVRSFFSRLTKECGFKVTPHRFRHTLATEMMKSPDRNLAMVKGLLGHRSVSTTMEYIEMDLEVTGQALENELSLYMDVLTVREEEASHILT